MNHPMPFRIEIMWKVLKRFIKTISSYMFNILSSGQMDDSADEEEDTKSWQAVMQLIDDSVQPG